MQSKYSSGARELRDLMVKGIRYKTYKVQQVKQRDAITLLRLSSGLVHHIILPMTRPRYRLTTHVHG